MMTKMLEKRKKLKDGEMVPLYFDEAFKIMYASADHLETLTILLSRVLKIEYQDLLGNITLLPLKNPNTKLGEKKLEKDVVVSIKTYEKFKIVIEVNVKKKFYESVNDRNIAYAFDIGRRGLNESASYDNLPITYLINFNTYYTDTINKLVFDEYLLRNENGNILSRKYKVFCINIAECYNLWYHNNYQGKFGLYEEDLLLLCAAMMVNKQEEFKSILNIVRMKPEIKELMEGVVTNMNTNREFVESFYDYEEDNRKLTQGIINEEKRESFNAGLTQGILQNKKEIVLNMYNKLSVEEISSLTGISILNIQEIINNAKN